MGIKKSLLNRLLQRYEGTFPIWEYAAIKKGITNLVTPRDDRMKYPIFMGCEQY